jgi:hypothetical protein
MRGGETAEGGTMKPGTFIAHPDVKRFANFYFEMMNI